MNEIEARRSARFLFTLFLVALALVALIVWPFAGVFFAAIVFAAVLSKPHEVITRMLGGRAALSAGTLSVLLLLGVVVPVGFIGLMAVEEGSKVVNWTIDTARQEGIDGLVKPVPEPIRPQVRSGLERFASEWVKVQQDRGEKNEANPAAALDDRLDTFTKIAGTATAALGSLMGFIAQLGILLVATFFLLIQGGALVDYLVELAPLEEEKSRHMLTTLRKVSVAVFSSTVITAAVQALCASIGFLIAGLPGLFLLFTATFICAFIPGVGAGVVSLVAAIVLFMGGDTGYAIFLLIWGVGLVGTMDNFLKPWLTKGAIQMPASLIFLGIIGGLIAFGPMGLIAGPMIVANFKVVAAMFKEAPSRGAQIPQG